MPTLKQISCSLELGPSNTKLKEYGHRFTDGGVEAYVVVPDADIPFSVHVTSAGYIAPGLAIYVFMDGQYQCNRNRNRLPFPSPGVEPKDYQIDFQFRQKEEKGTRGTFIGREWTFAQLKKDPASAASINKAFADNVGTIEVVVRRCQDTTAGPAFSAIAPPGPMSEAGAKALSVGKAESRANSKASSKAPSKALSKAPSNKAPSKAPSSKKASAAGEDIMGGLFGLFDGAGDAPDYRRFVPGFFVADEPSPRQREERSYFQYNRDDRDRRAFTIHGDNGRDRDEPRELARPQTAAGRYGPAPSPNLGMYSKYRPQAVAIPLPQSSRSQVSRDLDRPERGRNASVARGPSDASTAGLSFIRDMADQVDVISKLRHEASIKGNDLRQEADKYQTDAELRLEALKACRRKEQEVEKLDEDLHGLMHAVFARMRRMDYDSWHRARDFLVVEKRIVSAGHAEVQRWQDPEAQPLVPAPSTKSAPSARESADSKVARDDDWQELGEYTKKGNDWQKKEKSVRSSKAASKKGEKTNDGGWGQGNGWGDDKNDKKQDGDDPWGNNDDKKQSGNDGWGNGGNQKQPSNNGWGDNNADDAWGKQDDGDNGGGWGNEKEPSEAASKNDGWGNNSRKSKSQQNGWGNNSKKSKSQQNGWGNDNNQDDADNWGGARDDTKSQSHKSKVDGWNDGSKGAGGGWDNNSRGKGTKSAAKTSTKAGTTTQLEPVIKPYWANWDQPEKSTGKPRAKPRDPYQFPALSAPALPSGRTKDVNYGVQAGRGASYTHNIYTPEYLDPMDQPYAVFTFKYRSKAALEKTLGRKVDTDYIQHAIKEAEKHKLMHQPKDQLVEEMMKMRQSAGNVSKTPSSNPAPKAAQANDWGEQKDASNKPASNNDWGKAPSKPATNNDWGKAPSKTSKKDDAWGNGGGGDWGAEEKKSSKEGDGGWGAAKSASKKSQANDGWGNDGGEWKEDKPASDATPEHFAGEELQKTKAKSVPRNEGWKEAGW